MLVMMMMTTFCELTKNILQNSLVKIEEAVQEHKKKILIQSNVKKY